jgi:hypothetical protein
MRRGQPTSRVIAAALDTFLGVLVAAAVFVAVGDVARVVIAGAAAVLTFAGWSALAWVNVLPVPRSDEPAWRAQTRSRLALASLYAALVNGLASASTLWIAVELGDRLSNHRTPEGDAWYLAVQGPMFAVGAGLALAALVSLAGAARARRA